MGLTRIKAGQISDIDYKQAVRVITLSNVTLSGGAPTLVDGVNLAANDRVLVAGQDTGSQTGLYYVQTLGTGSDGTWVRTSDGNENGEIQAGMIVMVTEGDTYKDTLWKLTTNNPIVVGTTPLTFVLNTDFGFGNIYANSTGVTATAQSDVLTLIAGNNMSIIGNANTKTITFSSSGGGGNGTPGGNTTEVQFNNLGTFAGSSGFTFNTASNSIVVTGNISGGNITTTGLITTTGNVQAGNVQTSGLVSATGNITGGNIAATNHTGTTVSVTGAITGASVVGGVMTGTSLSASGNVTGGNILTGGLISATGNITGGNILGGANVNATTHTGTTVSVTANITGGNLISGALVSGTTLTATGNITGGNILTGGLISVTGNVTGGNVLTAIVSASGNVTGANFLTGGLISATGNITGGNLSGTNIVGTLTTAAQTNITSVGTLTGLSVTASNVSVSVTDSFNSATAIKNIRAVSGARDIAIIANIGGGSYNSLTATGDSAIIATGATIGNTGLTIAPWAGATSGIRISSASNVATIRIASTTVQIDGNIINGQANGVGNIGNSTGYFNTIFAKATSAQYADVAERYRADADYPVGTVLTFGGVQEVTQSSIMHDAAIAGTVSENPAYVMNAGLDAPNVVTVALLGRVPCRAVGSIRKGDLLVSSSTPGVATALNQEYYQPGCVIGKSLENYNSETEGIIEIVVGRL